MVRLNYLPDNVIAGETIWVSASNDIRNVGDIVIPSFLPTTHTLSYSFSSATPITVAAVANSGNTGWTLTVTAAQTLLWRPRDIHFVGYATNTSTAMVYAVDSGVVKVSASPLAVSQYATALAAVEAAIAAYGTNNIRQFQLGDMSISYGDLNELLALRDFYRAEVQRELQTRPKRKILTRFS